MVQFYEIVIFTAALQEYADPVLNHIDPTNRIISKRLYRQHTEFVNNMYNKKDLSIINADLSKTIIIDNIPDNFNAHRSNGIFIKSWYSDKTDTALRDLIPVLTDIVKSKCPDVRTYLNNFRKKLIEHIENGSLHPSLHI
jgi:CTD small phosphatase-like protein 2